MHINRVGTSFIATIKVSHNIGKTYFRFLLIQFYSNFVQYFS